MSTAIIDGSLLLYRSRFAIEKGIPNFTEHDLLNFFLASLIKLLNVDSFTQVYVLWDFGRPIHRSIPGEVDYKGDREVDTSREKEAQEKTKRLLWRLLPELGFVNIGHSEAEADDFAFLLSNRLSGGVLISEDSDWEQCLVRNSWKIYRPIKKNFVTQEQLIENNPFNSLDVHLDYLDYHRYIRALLGTHNNIPRIAPKGVGTVRAVKVIEAYLLGHPLPFFSSDDETQVEARRLIQRNLALVDMSWILAKSEKYIDVINESIRKTLKIKKQPDLYVWAEICSLSGNSNLMKKYNQYLEICGRLSYREPI